MRAGGAGLREPHRGHNGPGPVWGAGSLRAGTSAQLSPGVPPRSGKFHVQPLQGNPSGGSGV